MITQFQNRSHLYPAGSTSLLETRSHFQRRAHSWFVTTLILMGIVWLSPSVSWAGCSHYVRSKSEGERVKIDRIAQLATSWTTLNGSRRSNPLDQGPALPCSGIRCSRDSNAPATVLPTVPRIDAWASAQRDELIPRPIASALRNDDVPSYSLDRAERLARPPR